MTPLQHDRQQYQREAKIENVASRAGANGARIRNLRAESSRNQVSLLILVHKNAISQAGVGDHFRKSFRCRLEFVLPADS